MAEELSRETQTRIQDLGATIAAYRGLTGDAAEELRTHLEDKVLSYLDGNEALSEEDALLLAQAHFGVILEPASGGIAPFSNVPLARLVPTLVLVTVGVELLRTAAQAACFLTESFARSAGAIAASFYYLLSPVAVQLAALAGAFGVWSLLHRASRQIRCGGKSFLSRAHPVLLVVMATVLCILWHACTTALTDYHTYSAGAITTLRASDINQIRQVGLAVSSILGQAVAVALAMLWLWTCDDGVVFSRRVVAGASLYVFLHITFWALNHGHIQDVIGFVAILSRTVPQVFVAAVMYGMLRKLRRLQLALRPSPEILIPR